MNKLRYRIVFNKARGMCMAVAETARSQGKGSAQGAGGPADGMAPATLRLLALRRLVVLLGIGLGSLSLHSDVLAQVVADHTAPGQQRPTVLTTANGVIQVNVQTPSAAGVSHNTYSQFDAPQGGVILNNSRTNTQSQLGGWVAANPWMTQGTAKVILNEVNSSNPSRLQGYVEVAGDRAETVIANPAGIVVSGGGFINVSRATLTTGTPRLEDGKLTGYAVQRGQIVIDGAGLDASKTDYTALIARAVQVNAGIWAQRLDVIAGVNDVTLGADSPAVQARQASDSAPLYAIDVAKLGGMYANQIYLVGTEAGVGVRNAGELGAAAGELVVTSSGRLENTGSLAASKALRLQASDAVVNDGTSYARETVQVAGASFSNSGTVRSDGTVQVTAAGKLENSGSFSGEGDVQLAADSLTNRNTINSGGRLSVSLQGDADNRQGTIQAQSIALDSTNGKLLNQSGKVVQDGAAALDVTATALHNTNGGVVGADVSTGTGSGSSGSTGGSTAGSGSTGSSAGNGAGAGTGGAGSGAGTTPVAPAPAGWVHVAGAIENDAGQLLSSGPVNLSVTSLENVGSKMSLGSLAINVGALDNHGGSQLSVESNLSLHIPVLDNRGSQLQVDGNFSGDIQSFDNNNGLLSAGGDLQLHTSAIANHGGQLAAGASGSLAADGALDNSSGKVLGGSGLTVTAAGALDNTSGKIETSGIGAGMQLQAASINNTGGRIASSGAATLATPGNIGNSNGLISAQDNLSIAGADLNNIVTGAAAADSGIQSQAGNVLLGVQHLSNNGGVYAGKELNATATALDNQGTLYAGTRQNLSVNNAINNSSTIAAAHDLTVKAGSLNGAAGSVLAAGMAGNGQLTGAGGLAVTTTGALRTAGQAMATDDVILTGASLDLTGSSTGSTAGNVRLTAQSGNIVTHQAQVSTRGQLVINANQALDNSAGQLSGQQLQIQASQLDNSHGQIQQTGTGALAASIQSTGALNNSSGRIVANAQDFTLSSGGAITNTDGLISHAGAGQLTVNAGSLDNTRGQVTGNGQEALTSTGNIVNSDGLIAAQNSLNISSAGLSNTVSGAVATPVGIQNQAGDVHLNVQHLANSGSVTSAQDLSVTASAVDNSGTIYAAGQQTLSASGAISNGGTIAAAHDLIVNAGSLSGADASALAAGMANNGQLGGAGALSVTTTDALQTAGQAVATDNVTLKGASLDLTSSTTGSTAGDVSLTAQSGNLVTAHAQVSTPGKLAVNASQLLDNSSGQLSGQQLEIQAAQVNNSHGQIQQTGSGVQLASIHSTGALNNSAGHILANAQDFTVSAGGALTNKGGLIGAADTGQLTVNAGSLDNTSGQIVGNGAATLSSTGAVNNTSGLVSAQQGLSATAASWNNSQGKLVSVQNNLSLDTTQNTVTNTSGLIQAAQDLTLTLDGAGNTLQNAQGQIVAGHDANLSSGTLVNDSGLATAGHNLHIDTHGQSLSNLNTHSNGAPLGLVAGAQLDIQGGTVDNRAGLISAQTALNITSGGIVNASNNGQSGLIYSGSSLNLQGAGLDNTGSQVLAVQDATIALGGGQLNNGSGLVRVGQTLNVQAASVNNTATLALNPDGSPMAMGLEANVANITTGNLDNTQGAVRAGQDLTLHSDGQVTNNSGELSAGRTLQISADQAATPTLRLSNNAGQIVAGKSVDVRTGSLNGAGSIVSQGDVSLSLQGDYTVSGTLQAGGDLQLQATGKVTNPVALQAGNNLTVNGSILDNLASGQLLSGQTTTLNAAGGMVNRGLVDGADTHILTGALYNLGTGRIYGDRIAISAPTLNNVEEGGTAGTIAGRQGIDIGASNLTNREGALIYSGGDLAIGGGLDGNWQANGSAQQINNNSATIEAAQSLSIASDGIRNTDEHFTTAVQQVSQSYLVQYQGSATSIRYNQGDPGVYTFLDESLHLRTPDAPTNGWEDNWFEYDINRTIEQTVVTHSDPGKIIAGGGITLSASSILNDKSQIVAGGALRVFGTTIDNQEVSGTRTSTDGGTVIERWRVHHKGTDSTGSSTSAYAPGPETSGFTLQVTRQQEFAANVSTDSAPGATTRTSVQAQTTAAGAVGNANNSVNLNNVSGTQAASASGNGTVSHANGEVQTSVVSSAQAQGNSTSGQTAGQVSQPAGGATSGNVPGAPAFGSIVTTQPTLQLPTASLFKTHPEGITGFLVETDPRFTEYKQWASSDYMLDALQNAPATTQKRLGDGFYEQTLVREQILALTGHRFLGDYTSDDQEYKALMDNGLTYAKQWNLRPGVALSPEQVAQLTSDIVWLVTQEVTLPDGSKQSVLVPQVYVRVQPGDVDGSGALLSGRDVDINLNGDVKNSGTIAGRNLVRISADNIRNMGGTMAADTLALQATKDIDNIGGVMKAQSAAVLQAGHDLNITTTTQSSSHNIGANSFSQSGIDRVAGLYVSAPAGVLLASAGNNINLTAAQIINTGSGPTQLVAGNNLNLNTVNAGSSQRIVWNADNHMSQSSSQDVGTQIHTTGALTLNAGQDINAKAATINAGQALNVTAGRDLNMTAGNATQDVDAAFKHTEKGFLSKKTVTTTEQLQATAAIGSSLQGQSVNLSAGQNLTLSASDVNADRDVTMTAGRNLSIVSAEETSKYASSHEVKKSGLTGGFSSGVGSVGYGKSSSSAKNSEETVTQHSSSVSAQDGSVKLKAGETLQVVASDIAAKENLTLIGKNVDLAAAQNTSVGQQNTQSKSSGFSVGVTVNPLDAFKDAYKADTSNSKSTSFIGKGLSKAEGAADGAMAAMTVATVQFGNHSSNSTQNHAISEARTSSLTAGKDLTIMATDGSITSHGAQMSAEGNAWLLAKDSIKFDVAHTTENKSQTSKESGFSFDNRSAMMVGTLHNKGDGSGATDTVTGTKLSVGGSATMATQTGDITLKGANVVSEGDLSISAARNLTITSAQDTAQNANKSDNKAVGKVVISDTERFAGYDNEKHLDNSNQVTQVASNVSSLNGDVTLTAGDKYTQAASNVLAKNDVNITAKSIDITALQNTGSNQSADSSLKVGVFARVSSPLIDLVNSVEAARKSDDRLKAMQGMAAASNGYQAAAAMGLTGKGAKGELIKGEAGIGFASSNSSNNSNGSTAAGSSISGGGNVNLTATEGDIHATGATLGAGKTLSLDAAQNILLDASQSTTHSDGKNHSAGAEVGVGYEIGERTGVYAYATVSVANGHNNSDATTNNNTQLKADTINLHSKGDTTLKGATATANTINADVGGKLAIESLQDTTKEESSQTSAGARVQVSFGTAWDASGNVSQQKGSGSSAVVGQQSGLFVGDGGYHVKADTVDLKGGAIASTNKVDSELTTNKLTTANIENKMNYSASNVSLAGSIGGSSGEGDKDSNGNTKPNDQQQLFGTRTSGNVTPGLPLIQKGSDSSTTYATVTDGKITIGSVTTNSVKDLGINTDASKANTGLDKLPDLQKMLKEQQAMSAAAGTVIATSKQAIGDWANSASKSAASDKVAAQEVLDNPNSTAEQKAAATTAKADADKTLQGWAPGGIYNRALNAGVQILVGSLAGQSSGTIAANAMGPTVAKTVGDIGSQLQAEAYLEARELEKQSKQAALNNDPKAAAELAAKAAKADATSANWGDNGIYRVGLHSATQGILGSLANGQSGALEGAAGAVGGNLGQQLGEMLGKAEADRLGLLEDKRAALINAYQNSGAVIGGMFAGASAAAVSGHDSNGGAMLGAAQGGGSAGTIDVFNRQLHKSEAEKLGALKQGKSSEAKHRLDAAACALTHCADGVPTSDPLYPMLKSLQTEGQSYEPERLALKATGEFVYKQFSDPTRDLLSSHAEFVQRTGGAVNLGLGSLGTLGGGVVAVGGAATCLETLGAGCAAIPFGAYIAKTSNDQAQQGSQALFGQFQSSEGQRVLSSFKVQTYPGENDPLANVGLDGLRLGTAALAGKYIPKGLAAAEESVVGAGRAGVKASTAGVASTKAGLPEPDTRTGTIAPDSVGQKSIAQTVRSNIADSKAARASSNFDQFSKVEGQVQENIGIWPPNSGGYSPTYNVTLDVGTQLDRYGHPGGNFLSPLGASFGERALPSSYETTKPYFQYEITQPITGVTQAKVLPWFGQPGMGTQFQLPNSVDWYLTNGYLKVKKP